MTDDNAGIRALFDADESDLLERKRDGKDRDAIGKAICAFANDLPDNRRAGRLIIGQEDDKSCAGLSIDDTLLQQIANFASDGNVMPRPVLEVKKHTVNGCDICAVTVAPHASPPVRYKGDCWVRVGPTTRKANPSDEQTLNEKRQSGDAPFIERVPRPQLPTDELNLKIFREEYLPQAISRETLEENEREDAHQLKSLRFLSREGYPNYAAVLCFHDRPHHVLRSAYVQFARLGGDELDAPIKIKREITGNIFQQAREMDEIFRFNIETGATFIDGRRHDRDNYPLIALREIFHNALVHRIYEDDSAPVKCFWFSDRVEIHSPGGPYGRVTTENFADGQTTSYRNFLLAEAMSHMGFAERFGLGIVKAKNAARKNGNEIHFNPTGGNVLVTIFPAKT